MSYVVIQGTYRIIGFQPDGDSIRFAPHNVGLVNALPNRTTTLQPGKSIQLRLECIDALETHFSSGSPRLTHQPMPLGMAAREALLTLLGFSQVQWSADLKVVTGCLADDRPGYILTKTFDSYGTRPVAYAFAGPLPAGVADGDSKFLDAVWLQLSANYAMVRGGFAYPMYYEGAFHDIRAAFDSGVAAARAAGGANTIWPSDVTLGGFVIPPDTNLTHNFALWPKLFRRVSSFLKDDPTATIDQLPAWLEANRDECIDLDTGSWTALHNFVVWNGAAIQMTKDITRLMFKG